jgi:hypothetical protein
MVEVVTDIRIMMNRQFLIYHITNCKDLTELDGSMIVNVKLGWMWKKDSRSVVCHGTRAV